MAVEYSTEWICCGLFNHPSPVTPLGWYSGCFHLLTLIDKQAMKNLMLTALSKFVDYLFRDSFSKPKEKKHFDTNSQMTFPKVIAISLASVTKGIVSLHPINCRCSRSMSSKQLPNVIWLILYIQVEEICSFLVTTLERNLRCLDFSGVFSSVMTELAYPLIQPFCPKTNELRNQFPSNIFFLWFSRRDSTNPCYNSCETYLGHVNIPSWSLRVVPSWTHQGDLQAAWAPRPCQACDLRLLWQHGAVQPSWYLDLWLPLVLS